MAFELLLYNGVEWTTDVASPYRLIDRLGHLPDFLNAEDPRPAVAQLDSGYQFAGGWDPQHTARFRFNPQSETLHWPGDPVMTPLARARLREETILLFPHSWVLVYQPDGKFEVARMD